MGDILVGTSGFSFDDWVGPIYPPATKKQDMLPFYEQKLGFKALEVNFTYYSLPSLRTMESFARRTSSDFSFVVKAYKGMTHEPGKDLKEQCSRFKEALAPLGATMKALLFQFPYVFRPGSSSVDYLSSLRQEFAGYRAVVEFRNATWLTEGSMDMLRNLDYGYCIVDEPKLKGLVPFYPRVTSELGYFRFHGRNEKWFGASVDVRYDYLYSAREVAEFVDPIGQVAKRASETFVFFNNCHAGKAVQNARMLKEMLAERATPGEAV
jgi:uncharacterized protein YecE (DUF72 family)